ncbi:MAG: VanZ family protein [Firmicutes bacterium]|nr:VanZ family protein [Bacillota bacterium]
MAALPSYLYEAAAPLLPAALLFFLLGRREQLSRARRAGLLLLALYLLLVLHITGPGTLWDGLAHGFRLRPGRINLIPLLREIRPVNCSRARNLALCGLNVLLFLPLGLLVPALWRRWDRWYRVAGLGLLFSLVIEGCQLLNYRFADVDDLICNTCGTVLGWALWRLLRRLGLREGGPGGKELPLYLLALAAGRFLLYCPRLL